MSKSFVSIWRVPPPTNTTIFARIGNSHFDAAYCKWSNKWFLLANGREEEIAEPQFWFCDDEYAKANQRNPLDKPVLVARESLSLRKTRKPQQLVFGL